MDFVNGVPIESLETAAQEVRDQAMRHLIELVLREMFDWGLMQTDPNFGNYRWQPETERLVLLDFGAARAVPAETADGYRALLVAGLAGDRVAVREAAVAAGFLGAAAVSAHGALVDRMIDVIIAELGKTGPFDFGDRAFVGVLRDQGVDIAATDRPGTFPRSTRCSSSARSAAPPYSRRGSKAKVDIRELAEAYLGVEND